MDIDIENQQNSKNLSIYLTIEIQYNWCPSIGPCMVIYCFHSRIQKNARVTTRVTRIINVEEECEIKKHVECSYPHKSG